MAKYRKKIVNKIVELLKSDSYTVSELCTIVGIAESTFYDWQATKVEFSEAITRAREQFDELLVKEAKNSLRKKVMGYTVQEKQTVYVDSKDLDKTGKPKAKIKEQKIIEKHFQPDTAAIVFALTNKAPEEYKNRQNTEITGKDGKDLFSSLTDEQLEARIAELEKKVKQ